MQQSIRAHRIDLFMNCLFGRSFELLTYVNVTSVDIIRWGGIVGEFVKNDTRVIILKESNARRDDIDNIRKTVLSIDGAAVQSTKTAKYVKLFFDIDGPFLGFIMNEPIQ